ncbi:MAG: homoserine dehydrogenase, partial [Deltaproteobacteria bacterium]|nr:homoserine dehydrogenase [Deltaproteobacteria bacterium]
GKHDISLSSVIQKEKTFDKDKGVPIVVTTYKAREKNVRMALEEIDNTLEDVVFGKTTLIRIEDESLR